MAASRRDLPILRVLAALLLALGGLVAGNMGAGAEALPVRVILSHVPVMTTWGPPDANGVVMLVLEEGDIRADLVGLPPLGGNERYELWLLQSQSGETRSLGRFSVERDTPVTHVDFLLPEPIPDLGWDIVLVTVEPEPDPDPATPDPRRVLVGAFPGTPIELQLVPPVLPKTGEGATLPGQWAGLVGANTVLLLGLLRLRRARGVGRGR
ncbi:anti-sigma factor [Thermomicrobiaceae bacterium CFH 74404]|uniref:Anti-sigma factor n=1 Tax=Thermalbibacter longus TaxID=2951981 RepID=A0AA42BA66_9BACT|nr:anti-sigma factor [Thermalbibacter longus]MCM8749327.1 anti-sigma factor [Thermalbibacter longus]